MPNIKFNCLYCGSDWNDYFYSPPDMSALKCPNCKDSNIKIVKDVDQSDCFGYNEDTKVRSK